MEKIKSIAFTHRNIGLEQIGTFHIADTEVAGRLGFLKESLELDELLYLSTCNRVEFIFVTDKKCDNQFFQSFYQAFKTSWGDEEISNAITNQEYYEGIDAVNHLHRVASSLDSLVIGEREIITQVRNAYEKCRDLDLTGDIINLIVKQTIQTAKRIYTETAISRNPVSVVSLAHKKLQELKVSKDARFLIIGAGQTNYAMSNFLLKNEYSNFSVFNRTLKNAEKLADKLDGKAFNLNELETYKDGFDVIISCTGSDEHVINGDLYKGLVGSDSDQKVVVDLAIPNDFDDSIVNDHDVNLIAINHIREIANKNLEIRKSEISQCDEIVEEQLSIFTQLHKERLVELAMKEVPNTIREIKRKAVSEVFAKDLENVSPETKEMLDKILTYVEKKYISVPMKMAREIMVGSGENS